MLVLCVPDGSTVVGSDTGAVEKPRTRVVLPVAGVADDSGCVDDIPEGVLVVLSIVDSEGGIVSVGVTAMSETLLEVEGEVKLLVVEGELKLLVVEGELKLLVVESGLKLLVVEGGLKLLVAEGELKLLVVKGEIGLLVVRGELRLLVVEGELVVVL